MNSLFDTYKGSVDFRCIYIREAHPDDGWQLDSNRRDKVVYASPVTIDERANIAEVCVLRMNLAMPMLLDSIDDAVDQAYCALPERLYVIDKTGVITWRSEMGPGGFDTDEWEVQLKAVIAAG